MEKKRKVVTDNELETPERVDFTFQALKDIFEVKTDLDLANKIGISQTAIYNHKVRGTLPFRSIVLSALRSGFSLDDIFSKVTDSGIELPGKQYQIFPYAEFGQTGKPMALSVDLLASLDGFDSKTMFYVKINQEYSLMPTLTPGDTVLVSTDAVRIQNYDGIFMCRINGRNTIKRLQFLPGGAINVESNDNKPYRLEKTDYAWSGDPLGEKERSDRMEILARVIWAGVKK
jgi:hypothetical protein